MPPGPGPAPPPGAEPPPGGHPGQAPPPPPAGEPQPPGTPPAGPAWLNDSLPPEARQFLGAHPEIRTVLSLGTAFAKPLLFAFMFLLVGLLFSSLVRRAIVPSGLSATGSKPAAGDPERRSAAWSILVWALALLIASEAVGVSWGSQVIRLLGDVLAGLSGLLGAVLGVVGQAVLAVGLVVAAAVVVYAVAPGGRDLVLSVLGWYYLTAGKTKPAPGQTFDLGGGVTATIEHVDALHTTFATPGGGRETRPNSFLMRTYFNWGAGAET